MPLHLKTAFLTIAAANFEGLVEFYQQLLSQKPDRLIPNIYAEFHLPNLKLGIFRPKQVDALTDSQLPTPHSRSSNSLSLCLEVENLEEAIAHLTQLGYPTLGAILTASHGKEIYAYDPEGNCLILHQQGRE